MENKSFASYLSSRKKQWDMNASKKLSLFSNAYHKRLNQVFINLIPEKSNVLELGCGSGDLLAQLRPNKGVGIDFSNEMIEKAQKKYPHLYFEVLEAHELSKIQGEKFDYIILSDLVNDLWDVQTVLDQIRPLCLSSTRIIINFYSRIWQLPLLIATNLHLAQPRLEQNWLTVDDLKNLLHLSGFESIRTWREVFLPINIPIINWIFNVILVKLWPFHLLALSNFIIARPEQTNTLADKKYLVTVLVPARNEAGNIRNIISRVPDMGAGTELIFVEGHSSDNTYETIKKEIENHPDKKIFLDRQDGKGKGDAVRKGFSKASGDILMILDADLTVPPEDLPRFYEAIASGKGEFINGVRLVYPMEKEAMRFLNFLGNKFFSLAFSWLLGQPIKDTLCGTKVLWRKDYNIIVAQRLYFGDFDPFGDFDLIFGAVKINRKLVDLPIRYRERTYGTTNISRWKHGFLLLRMVLFAAKRIKFI